MYLTVNLIFRKITRNNNKQETCGTIQNTAKNAGIPKEERPTHVPLGRKGIQNP